MHEQVHVCTPTYICVHVNIYVHVNVCVCVCVCVCMCLFIYILLWVVENWTETPETRRLWFSSASISFAVVWSFSHVWLFVTPWNVAHQASLSFTISQSLLRLMSIESVMPSSHPILRPLFYLPSIFPRIRVFSNEEALPIRWPKNWNFRYSSVLLMNIQDEFPLGLTGLISLQSKGLSILFSNTTVQKHQFFSIQPSLWSNSHIHTYLLEKP